MRTRTILLIASLFSFSFAGIVHQHSTAAQGSNAASANSTGGKASGGKTSYEEPVTTVVFDYDLTGALLLMRSDDYNGSGQATYTTAKASKGPGNVVTSQITTDGQWLLALSEQSGRTLWITPNQAIDNSQPAVPPAGYYVIQKTYSVCRDQSDNIVPFPNLVNGSGNCSLAVNFFYGGILYKLLMRPGELDGTLCPLGGCPATGLAKVTCNAVSNNQCVNWTITPNADAPRVGVANLYSYTGPRGSEWVFIGQYYNTFRINASYS